MKTKNMVSAALKYLAVIVILLCSVGLFLYIFSSSFKPLKEVMGRAAFFPKSPTLSNYKALFFSKTPNRDFVRFIMNSLGISLIAAAATCVISSMAAYGFSRHDYPGKSFIMKFLLFIYVFPTIILLVPMYKVFSSLKMVDNYASLAIMYTALAAPFCTWILISFFDSIPKSMEEAAKVDGASNWATFTRILLPIATPGLVTVSAYAFITSWGEYMFASILIRSSTLRTVTLGMVDFTSDQYIEWGLLLAGSTVVILPVFLLFMPISGNFIKGFTAGAVKE